MVGKEEGDVVVAGVGESWEMSIRSGEETGFLTDGDGGGVGRGSDLREAAR